MYLWYGPVLVFGGAGQHEQQDVAVAAGLVSWCIEHNREEFLATTVCLECCFSGERFFDGPLAIVDFSLYSSIVLDASTGVAPMVRYTVPGKYI